MQKASKAPHTLKSTRKSVAKTSKKPISTVISNKSTRTTTKPRTSPSFQLPTPSTFTSRKINMSTDSSPDASPELGSRIKVYTKTGDKGTAVLYTMERLPKNSDYFEALGHTDEVNSTIGLAREYFINIPAVVKAQQTLNAEHSENEGADDRGKMNIGTTDVINIDLQLQIIQSRLLDVGSCIATPASTSPQNRLIRVEFDPAHVETLEKWIDMMDAHLPPLTVFILPSGGLSASTLHVARTITRRAERSVVPLVFRGDCNEAVLKYLNRLSDYLFTAARYSAKIEGKAEVTYKKATARQIAAAQAAAEKKE